MKVSGACFRRSFVVPSSFRSSFLCRSFVVVPLSFLRRRSLFVVPLSFAVRRLLACSLLVVCLLLSVLFGCCWVLFDVVGLKECTGVAPCRNLAKCVADLARENARGIFCQHCIFCPFLRGLGSLDFVPRRRVVHALHRSKPGRAALCVAVRSEPCCLSVPSSERWSPLAGARVLHCNVICHDILEA